MSRLFLVCLFALALLHADEPRLVLQEDQRYLLGKSVGYLEDKGGTLSFSEVRQQAFTPHTNDVVSFGFTSSVYWLKTIIVPNRHSQEHKWWIKIDYPLLDTIDYYVLNDAGDLVAEHRNGETEPFDNRLLRTRNFVFALPPFEDSALTLFVRVETGSSMQVPMMLQTSEDIIEEQQGYNLLTGFYYGIFLIIIFYNIVLYFYTREKNYLLYLFFLFSFIVWQLTLDGLGVQYLWSQWDWMLEHGGTFLMALLAVTALWFGRSFLQTQTFLPKLDRVVYGLMLVSMVTMVAAVFVPYGVIVPLCASLAVVVPIVLLSSGVMVLRKNYRPARFYVIGWSAFLLGSLIFALNKFNIFTGFYLLNHAQQFGSAMEMIFLSWALADRVKLLQDEYVEKINSLNQTLQEKVKEALGQARDKDQMLIEQSRLAAMGEMIEQIAHQWRQPLQTMALINQDLYVKVKLGLFENDEIEKVNEQFNENLQYMSKTIDDFRNFYKSDKAVERCQVEEVVKAALALSEATLKYAKIRHEVNAAGVFYIQAIRNELIQVFMNLIKNARDVIIDRHISDGAISIVIDGDEDEVRVSFEDNGGGINPAIMEMIFEPYFTTKEEHAGTGIGLYMSRAIIERNMNGSINVENGRNGARFVITLPVASVVE